MFLKGIRHKISITLIGSVLKRILINYMTHHNNCKFFIPAKLFLHAYFGRANEGTLSIILKFQNFYLKTTQETCLKYI